MSDTPRVDHFKRLVKIQQPSSHNAYESCLLLLVEVERELTAANKRIAELEQVSAAGVKDATDETIQNACRDLPHGYEICLFMENDSAYVCLYQIDGDRVDFPEDGESIKRSIREAVEHAIAMAKGVQS